jgi:hypothetical protein
MYPGKLEYLSWDQGNTYSLDKLLGTDSFRLGKLSADMLAQKYVPGVEAFTKAVQPYLLYR